MSTKIQLLELAKSRHPQVHELIIQGHCGRAYNQLLWDTAFGSDFDMYAKRFLNVAVKYDEVEDTYYLDYPEEMVQLPDGAKGVRRINRMKGKGREFVPIEQSAIPAFQNLVVSKVDKTIGYTPTQDRIELERSPGVEVLKVFIVIPFEKYGYEDVVYLPKGQDEKFWALVDQFLNQTPPINKINS